MQSLDFVQLFQYFMEYMNEKTKREFKNQVYAQFARITKALSNPHRLELLDLLAQGEHTVEELARGTGLTVTNASQHLQTLHAARLVEVRSEGIYRYYRLSGHDVFEMWRGIRKVGEERLADVDRIVDTFLQARDTMETMTLDDLLARYEAGDMFIVDVRPASEYAQGHIPDAVSMPIDEFKSRLRDIPEGQDVIVYCRGPYCVFADDAVEILQAEGIDAIRLSEGLPDWRARGLPVIQDKME